MDSECTQPTSQSHAALPTNPSAAWTRPAAHPHGSSAQDASVSGTLLPPEGTPPQAHASHQRPARLRPRSPARRPSALTDHLLQLVVVPVDRPGQGARVLGHDGCGAWLRAPHARGSRVTSPRASPRPAAAPDPPLGPASGRTTPGRAGQARPRGGDARLRPTSPPAAPRPAVPGPAHEPAPASAAPRLELPPGPAPLVPPSTRTPGTGQTFPSPSTCRRAAR